MNAAIHQKLTDLGYFTDAAIEARDALGYGSPETHEAAVQHYQTLFTAELDSLTRYYHGRSAVVDGDAGPATSDLILVAPRCGCPDFANREEASFPDSCRREITTSFRMSLNGISDADLLKWYIEADQRWAEALEVEFRNDNGKFPTTNIYSDARNLSGSTLAWQTLSMGRCSDRLEGTFDRDRTWSELLFIATCAHEHGHALGLGHVNGNDNLMNPYITQRAMRDRGKPSEADIAAMLRLGYKRRTTPPDPPKPPEPPDDIIDLTIWRPLAAGRYQLRKGTPGGGWSI